MKRKEGEKDVHDKRLNAGETGTSLKASKSSDIIYFLGLRAISARRQQAHLDSIFQLQNPLVIAYETKYTTRPNWEMKNNGATFLARGQFESILPKFT